MWAEFTIDGDNIKVQCQENDSIENLYAKCLAKIQKKQDEDIVFMYNGKIAEPKLKIKDIINREDRARKKLSIITDKYVIRFVPHNNIVCPICFSEAYLKFKDYKIDLKCENGHINNNLLVKEYMKTQEIESIKIICEYCKKANLGNCKKGDFFRCVKCSLNICINCVRIHVKEHNQKHNKYIDKFDLENYECYIHKNIPNPHFIMII